MAPHHVVRFFYFMLIYIFLLVDYPDWPFTCVKFSALRDIDIRSYLKRKKVISKKEADDFIVNERNLIANRLKSKDMFVDDSMSICPKHRSSYGIDWCDVKFICNHPDHRTVAVFCS